MKKVLLLAISIIVIACSIKPEPLQYGMDACYTCKMTLMDNKYGAELVTRKGKVYKFDDINCMLNFYHSGSEATEDFKHILIIDFTNPEKFIDAQHALYIKSANIRTPMASGIAAFENQESLKSYLKEWKGILMSWGEVQTQFK
jgi:copper chaperone NosL